MKPDLSQIEQWFSEKCDGAWEHENGVKIETIDNPGWMVSIDLPTNDQFPITMEDINVDFSDRDWMHCFIREGKFMGYGDPKKLTKILETFLKVAVGERP